MKSVADILLEKCSQSPVTSDRTDHEINSLLYKTAFKKENRKKKKNQLRKMRSNLTIPEVNC